MPRVNKQSRTITWRILYLGADGSGKRANLEVLAKLTNREGRLVDCPIAGTSVTYTSLHVELGRDHDDRRWTVRAQVLAVPSASSATACRRDLLAEADGVVVVIRPQRSNPLVAVPAWDQYLHDAFAAGVDLDRLPMVLQWNHGSPAFFGRSPLPLAKAFTSLPVPRCDAVVATGDGVSSTLQELSAICASQWRSGQLKSSVGDLAAQQNFHEAMAPWALSLAEAERDQLVAQRRSATAGVPATARVETPGHRLQADRAERIRQTRSDRQVAAEAIGPRAKPRVPVGMMLGIGAGLLALTAFLGVGLILVTAH